MLDHTYQNSPSSWFTLSMRCCSCAGTLLHSCLAQQHTHTHTQIPYDYHKQDIWDRHWHRRAQIESYPFMSLQGPSHSALPHGLCMRTSSKGPNLVSIWWQRMKVKGRRLKWLMGQECVSVWIYSLHWVYLFQVGHRVSVFEQDSQEILLLHGTL